MTLPTRRITQKLLKIQIFYKRAHTGLLIETFTQPCALLSKNLTHQKVTLFMVQVSYKLQIPDFSSLPMIQRQREALFQKIV